MDTKYLYMLIFGIPGFLLATMITVQINIFAFAFVWASPCKGTCADFVFLTIYLISLFGLTALFVFLGYRRGKKIEDNKKTSLNTIYIVASVIISIILLIAIISVGVTNVYSPILGLF